MKNITKQKLDLLNNQKESVIDYLKTHTWLETRQYFGVTRKTLDLFAEQNNICHPGKGANNDLVAKQKTKDIISSININELLDYYNNHSKKQTLDKYQITSGILSKILLDNNITEHSKIENTIYTNREKYGCDNVFQNAGIIQKCYDTKLALHGDGHFVNPQKAKETNLNVWGSECPLHSEALAPVVEQIILTKYGAKTYFGSKAGNIKSHQNRWKNYWLKAEYSLTYKELRADKEASIEFLKQNYLTREELVELFNCTRGSIENWLRTYVLFDYVKPASFDASSKFEDEIYEFICSLGVEPIRHNRDVLEGQEIDIYLPNQKIGIECNGDYWHSDINKPKYYHENKSKLAESKGLRLIHIYQSEWVDHPDKLKSMLKIALGKVNTKIYARQCEVRLISNKEAKPFNDANHLQGHRNAKVTYGLFYKDELVQLMSFSKHAKYEWEIIRGCPASNNIVVGGVSKLFKHFINDYNPTQVFSYCDFNKFDGTGYEALGMSFIGYTGPDKKLLMKDGSVINRSASKYAQLKPLVRAIIWGAGSKKYLYTKNY